MQRPISRYYVKRKSKLAVFMESLPSELGDSHRIRAGKIVGIRGDEGEYGPRNQLNRAHTSPQRLKWYHRVAGRCGGRGN